MFDEREWIHEAIRSKFDDISEDIDFPSVMVDIFRQQGILTDEDYIRIKDPTLSSDVLKVLLEKEDSSVWHGMLEAMKDDNPECHVIEMIMTEVERLKELESENRELKRANEILRKAAAFFAQAEGDGQAILSKPK